MIYPSVTMAIGYTLIYPCSYHGNGIYLKYASIVSFDVMCQNGIWFDTDCVCDWLMAFPAFSCFTSHLVLIK